MSKVSEEQAAEILRESMERMSPIRQKLDAHCRAVEQRINRAKDPYVRIEELEMANEHCHEAMQKQAERIVDLEAVLRRIRARWKFTMNVLDDGLQIEMDRLLGTTSTQRQVVHAANCPVGGNFACTCGADSTSAKESQP